MSIPLVRELNPMLSARLEIHFGILQMCLLSSPNRKDVSTIHDIGLPSQPKALTFYCWEALEALSKMLGDYPDEERLVALQCSTFAPHLFCALHQMARKSMFESDIFGCSHSTFREQSSTVSLKIMGSTITKIIALLDSGMWSIGINEPCALH